MNINWLIIPTLVAGVLFFVCGQKAFRNSTKRWHRVLLTVGALALCIPGILFPLYYLHLFDDAMWFYEFRSIPFIEVSAGGVGVLAGTLAEVTGKLKRLSRPFLIAVLCICLIAPYLKPVVAPLDIDKLNNTWKGNVCMQSTPSSCGAASAATVFMALGHELSEKEIAHECHTYGGGTENWYIARAFRRRGYRVTYRVEQGFPPDLRPPAIAGIRMGGIGHFIAIVSKADGIYLTGDPLVGPKEVPAGLIDKQIEFTGFFMEVSPVKNN